MTQHVSKRGRRYTEGSHATPEPGFPNVCCSCGERIYTSRQSFQHHTEGGVKSAWHTDCPSPWKQAA